MKSAFAPVLCGLLLAQACTGLKNGRDRLVPDTTVQLEVSSLYAKRVQEQGLLGAQEGDELALVYSLNAYDENGSLVAVNNGFWGTRTIHQDTRIASREFEKISVPIPKGGRVIAALSLVEVDDYKGERKMGNVRRYTKSEHYPKFLGASKFDNDRQRTALELIGKSLEVAGYNNFITKQLNLSLNEELGGTVQAFAADELGKIRSGASAGKKTYEMDGSLVNENYWYELTYDLDVKAATAAQAASSR